MADLGDGTAKARLAQIEQTNSKAEKSSAQTQNLSNSAPIASSSSSAFMPPQKTTSLPSTQAESAKPADSALTLQQQQEQLAAYFAQQHMVIQYYKSAGYDMSAYENQLGTQIAAAAAAAQAGKTFAVPTSGATLPGS